MLAQRADQMIHCVISEPAVNIGHGLVQVQLGQLLALEVIREIIDGGLRL
jgi:hypothetical protein